MDDANKNSSRVARKSRGKTFRPLDFLPESSVFNCENRNNLVQKEDLK